MAQYEGSGAYGAAAVAKAIKGADFPMSKQDLLNKYGDKEIEYHIGKREKLKDILENMPSGTFNSAADLEHALHEEYEGR